MKKNIWVILILILWAVLTVGRLFSLGLIPRFLALAAQREDSMARQFISALKAGDYGQAGASLYPDLGPGDRKALPAVGDYLNRAGDLVSMRLLNVSFFNYGEAKIPARQLSYYADFSKTSLYILVVLIKNGDGFWVGKFQYQPLPQSFEKTSSFSLLGKSWFHYLYLLAAVLLAAFTFFALAKCINSRVRRKWFWIPFIIAGIGKFGLVWNGSSWHEASFKVMLLGLQLFSGGILKTSVFQPWTLFLSLPVGALMFYFLHVRKTAKAKS